MEGPSALAPAGRPLVAARLAPAEVAAGLAFLCAAGLLAICIGPADLPVGGVLHALAGWVPGVSGRGGLDALQRDILFQVRAPRICLGAVVGAGLALAGASYQGVFQNALADPYLLGVASGAGLGATLAISLAPALAAESTSALPIAAFAGACVAVAATYALGRSGRRRSASTLVLGGVAVGSFFTAIQTFVQQRAEPTLEQVYAWILGGLSTATWQQVALVAPYVVCAAAVLLGCRRLLDVLAVGDEEAAALGLRPERIRLAVIAAATLLTAAVVSVSGLIGFVGIIVPHTIRLVVGPSYKKILPLSVLFGAGFLVLCDLVARTVLSPAEVPIGVITAALGAPFFLVVLRQSRMV